MSGGFLSDDSMGLLDIADHSSTWLTCLVVLVTSDLESCTVWYTWQWHHCEISNLHTGFLCCVCVSLPGVQCLPRNSQDIVQCLKSLQPLLQDAVQYKTITRLWEHTYKLQGPLSWKDFHQLSGRS